MRYSRVFLEAIGYELALLALSNMDDIQTDTAEETDDRRRARTRGGRGGRGRGVRARPDRPPERVSRREPG